MFRVLDKDSDGHAPLVCGGDDCNDGIGSIHPGATEQCNGADDDCDGVSDNNASSACKSTEVCVVGACTCKPENQCGSKCLDIQTDAANCGGCGKKCAAGASCVAGNCTCPTGQLECVGACSNPDAATSKCPAVVQLAPGGVQTCILLNDGSARCWGLNSDGELGDGTTTASRTPVLVQSMTDGIQLAGGYAHNCALHGTKAVSCWGDWSQRETSVGQLSGAVEISAGSGFHSCARLADGTVTCWGSIYYASDIIYGTPIVYSTSSLIPNVADSVELSSGYEHSCARLADGTLRCWGWNGVGQLGDGTINNQTTAVTVQGVAGAVGVAAGGLHTCAQLGDGTVACWGDYSFGQLGDVSAYLEAISLSEDAGVPPGLPPVLVAGISDTVKVVAGRFHSCALLGNGTVKCWGANSKGQLGNGTTTDSASPVTVQSLSNGVEVRAGAYHTCARLADDTVKCWGANSFGQLGDGTTNDSPVPVTVVGF
jgi:alpha-tubulin suppressor-like RCC1 family protein